MIYPVAAADDETDALAKGALGVHVPTAGAWQHGGELRIADIGTAARRINDAGVIVGFTGRPDGTPVGLVGTDSRGFLMVVPPDGDAPGAQVACEGINNLRQVVCEVTDALGNNRAFIGSPND